MFPFFSFSCHANPNPNSTTPDGGLLDCPISAFTDDANADLKYHSSHQALSDIANFHEYIVEKYALTPNNKWISFGGSYPGMLAAWTRLKFPHLIHAAVSLNA